MPQIIEEPALVLPHNPYQIWYEQWVSLDTELTNMLKQFENVNFPQKETIFFLTQQLKIFAKEIFDFFYLGFLYEANPQIIQEGTYRIKPIEKYPAEFILRQTLNQISYDIQLIQIAAAQRQPPSSLTDSSLADRLQEADKLAQRALQPAIEAGIIPKSEDGSLGPVALTYCATGLRARVIPYASVVLIAIPFATTIDRRDILAIAHEVGHYVYWHGHWCKEDQQPEWMAQKTPSWLYKWREEIFADVYGARVGGLPVALSAQDVLLDNLPELSGDNDQEHPVSYIRPFTYTDLFRLAENDELAGNAQNDQVQWANKLDERWQEKRHQPKKPDGFYIGPRGYPALSFEEGREKIKELAKKIWETFDLCNLQADDWSKTKQEALELEAPKTVEDLNRLYTALDINSLMHDAQTYKPKQLRNAALEELSRKPSAFWSEEEWEQMLTYGGWVTRGPEVNPNPPGG